MAGIDVGGGHGKRNVNHEIPLIPFIDFLLCLVAFLLVTAVWSQMARINADARVPGPPQPDEPKDPPKEKQLHVEMKGETKFQLVWKEGTTVVNTIDIEKKAVPVGEGGDTSYPDLAKKITEEWNANGSHRAATDTKLDQAVLHTDNSTPFAEVIAVIDAIYTPKRDYTLGGKTEKLPAFNVTFSVN
jgi:biopolymer transport protein ExbD